MRIASEEIPQADTLSQVVRAIEAIAGGASTYQSIARAIDKTERQGRYYRKAAELLGFVERHGSNEATITPAGRDLLASTGDRRTELLQDAILSMRLFQRVTTYLASHERATSSDIRNFISTITEPTGPSMIPRRVSTVLGWLSAVGIIVEQDDRSVRFRPRALGNRAVNVQSDDEPLLPSTFGLAEYEGVARNVRASAGYLEVAISHAARERAERSHQNLLDLLAARLRRVGAVPRFNRYVDLAARHAARDYIFEIKSCTNENMRSQVRAGLSQLYEYQHLQRAPQSHLVLVLEQPPTGPHAWMAEYLVHSRGVLLCWDGDGELHCPPELQDELPFID